MLGDQVSICNTFTLVSSLALFLLNLSEFNLQQLRACWMLAFFTLDLLGIILAIMVNKFSYLYG